MVICQAISKFQNKAGRLAAPLTACFAALPGCVVVRLAEPPPAWPPAPPPPAGESFSWGLYLLLGLAGLLVLGLGLAIWRARERREDCLPLDLEDQALLRTARAALGYLIKRRMKRLRLVIAGKH
jgi:hypothetical protein